MNVGNDVCSYYFYLLLKLLNVNENQMISYTNLVRLNQVEEALVNIVQLM
jgi:hypothetical protein